MARSSWKQAFCAPYIIEAVQGQQTTLASQNQANTTSRKPQPGIGVGKRIENKPSSTITPIRVWSRASTILPNFAGKVFNVHNGMRFIRIEVTPLMIGHKFGEFATTRKIPKHPKLKTTAATMNKKTK